MKKLLLTTLCAIFLVFASAQCKLDYSNYHLVLNEEFNTSLADLSTRWAFDTGDPEWLGADGGIEYFDPNQVSILPGGILRLMATKIPTTTLTTPSGKTRTVKYKSGMLRSTMIVDPNGWLGNGFQYGIFEMRAKLPSGLVGYDEEWDAWPTFWLASGPTEIDIIDDITPDPSRKWMSGMIDWTKFPSSTNPDWDFQFDCGSCGAIEDFNSSVSYPVNSLVKYNNKVYKSNKAIKYCSVGIHANKRHTDLQTTFNTYTAVWTPTKVTFFLNGVEVCTISSSNIATYPYPCRIVASLQMMAGGILSGYAMDIDYIKVWKPNNNNYNLPYKTSMEFMNHDVNLVSPNYVASNQPNAISTNPYNGNEVFFRSMNNTICVAKKQTPYDYWIVNSLPLNDGAIVSAVGDVRYHANKDMLLYVGSNNRINIFGRSLIQPSGFYHWYLTSNYNCYWCNTDDLVSALPGSLAISSNDDVFFRGVDDKMHRYYVLNGNWNHQILPGNYTYAELVSGNIVAEGSTVYYRGNDGRLQCFYKNGVNYNHVWIDDNWSTTAYTVNPKAGSTVWAPSQNGVFYIGADNKIHLYYWDVIWRHVLIPYNYSSPSLGYPNADLAYNSLTWDNVYNRLYYVGFDGRVQCFGKTGSQWWHMWVDEYWNTDKFCSFETQLYPNPQYGSCTMGPEGIFYTRRDRHVAYFKYENCEILDPPGGYSPDLAKPSRPESEGDNILSNPTQDHATYANNLSASQKIGTEQPGFPANNDVIIAPNPSNNGIFNVEITSANKIKGSFDVFDFMGKRLLTQELNTNSTTINLATYPNGIYLLTLRLNSGVYTRKLIKR